MASKEVARLGDNAKVPSDAHGCPACPHTCVGPHVKGSPNVFANGMSAEDWNSIAGDPRRPLHDRAIASYYAPGSVFKVIMAIAGLESGVIAGDRVAVGFPAFSSSVCQFGSDCAAGSQATSSAWTTLPSITAAHLRSLAPRSKPIRQPSK